MNMRILKTPQSAIVVGCGYVGSRVAATWKKQGSQIFVVTRSESKAAALADSGFVPIVLDLSQTTSFPQLPAADTLLWSVGFDRTPGISRDAIWIDGLRRLLDALPARNEPWRLIYTSSTSVYGDGTGQDVDESTEPNPVTEGGKACLEAERLLQDYAAGHSTAAGHSAIVSILRLAGIYGPARLLRRVSDLQKSAPILFPPDDWLNLIHVDDAVAAIDAISHLESPPTIMNVAARETVTRRTYYSTLASMTNSPPPVFEEAKPNSAPQAARRGGNRRVVSVVRPKLNISFQFDSIVDGLRHALQ